MVDLNNPLLAATSNQRASLVPWHSLTALFAPHTLVSFLIQKKDPSPGLSSLIRCLYEKTLDDDAEGWDDDDETAPTAAAANRVSFLARDESASLRRTNAALAQENAALAQKIATHGRRRIRQTAGPTHPLGCSGGSESGRGRRPSCGLRSA